MGYSLTYERDTDREGSMIKDIGRGMHQPRHVIARMGNRFYLLLTFFCY